MKSYFEGVLKDVHYRGWGFYVVESEGRCYLQLKWVDEDGDTGIPAIQTGRKWFLSPHMTKSEIVQTALKAVLTAEEHEARERFRYKGKAIFGPHLDVDVLLDILEAKGKEVLDVRS